MSNISRSKASTCFVIASSLLFALGNSIFAEELFQIRRIQNANLVIDVEGSLLEKKKKKGIEKEPPRIDRPEKWKTEETMLQCRLSYLEVFCITGSLDALDFDAPPPG